LEKNSNFDQLRADITHLIEQLGHFSRERR
jgi:hypothetical protein